MDPSGSSNAESKEEGDGSKLPQPQGDNVSKDGKPMSKNALKRQRRWEQKMNIKRRRKEQERQIKIAMAKAQGRDLEKERKEQEERTKSGEGHRRREEVRP